MKLIMPIIVLLLSTSAMAAFNFTISGRIQNPDGTQLSAPAVNFKVQVRSPNSDNCLLFEEVITVPNVTNGDFTLKVGTGTRSAASVDGGLPLDTVLKNDKPLNLTAATTPCTGAVTTYTPLSSDNRKVYLSFNDGSANGPQTIGTIDMNWTSLAVYADRANSTNKLQNFPLSPVAPVLNQVLQFDGTNWSPANITNPFPSQVGNAGKVLGTDGTNASWVSALTNILPSAQIFVGSAGNTATAVGMSGDATLSNAGVLTLSPSGVTASSVGSASSIPSFTVDSKGRVTAVSAQAYQDATAVTKGVVSVGSNLTVSSGSLSLTTANVNSALGYAPLSSSLTSGTVFVGNTSNVATGVAISGDATLSNSGALTLNTVSATKGGTGQTTYTIGDLLFASSSSALSKLAAANLGYVLTSNGPGTAPSWQLAATGTVTNVSSANLDISVASSSTTPVLTLNSGTGANQILKLDGTAKIPAVDGSQLTGFTALQIPALDTSKITTGVLPIIRGGTGAATVNAALNNLLPAQATNANKFLQTDGTNTSWVSGNAGTVTNVSGAGPISVATGTSTPVISISTANTTTTGALSSGDWNIFNGKLGSSLTSGSIFVGSAGNVATGVAMSGDATISNSGTLSLTPSGVTAGTYGSSNQVPQILVDTKGRLTSATSITINDNTKLPLAGGAMSGSISMGAFDITGSGNILMSANTTFQVSNLTPAQQTTLIASLLPADAGKTWYNTGTNSLMYWNGTAVQQLATGSSSISNINGLTAATQSFAVGTSGTDFGVSSVGSTHTFNIPTATATNRGALSSADFTTFNNKLSSSLSSGQIFVGSAGNVATGVSLSGDATISNAGVLSLSTSGVTAGTVGSATAVPSLTVDAKGRVTSISSQAYADATGVTKGIVQVGSNLTSSAGIISLTSAGVTGALTYTPVSNALTSGQVFVGSVGNVATGVVISGDAALSNSGALTLANSGVTAGTSTKVTYDSKGRVTAGASLSATDIPALDASKITTGILPVTLGGTGAATANNSLNNLLPTQTANANKFLQTDGTNTSWVAAASGTVTNVTGAAPISVATGSTTPSISIANANTTTTGALTSADWNIFNGKLGSSLTSGNIFVGSAGNVATGVALSGDATISTAGALTLTNGATTRSNLGLGTSAVYNVPVTGDASAAQVVKGDDSRLTNSRAPSGSASGDLTGTYPAPTLANIVVAGTSTKITYDAKGRVTAGATLSATDIPALDASKITTGNLPITLGGTGGATSTAALNNLLPIQTANANKFLQTDGTNSSWVSGNAGTLTSITAGAGLTGGSITSSGTIGLGAELAGLNALSTLGFVKRTGSGAYSASSISLTTDVSGVLPIASGGTNNGGLPVTAGGVIYTDGTKLMNVGAGSAGQVLSSNAAGAPTWINAATGNVTSVSSTNTDIGVSMASPTPVLTLNSGTGANQIVKLDGTSKLPAVNGSQLTGFTAAQIPSLDASKITTGILPITLGGTGAVTANAALNNILPTQTANATKFLQTDGTNTSWVSGNVGTVTNVTGTAPISVATGTSTPVVSIATANTTTTGALASADWNIFNGKLGSSLTSGNIFVGSAGNVATGVAMSGDATLSNAGALSLSTSGVTAGTYNSLTVDAKGRATAGSNVANTLNANLTLSNLTSPTALNQDLLPASPYVTYLGSNAKPFFSVYTQNMAFLGNSGASSIQGQLNTGAYTLPSGLAINGVVLSSFNSTVARSIGIISGDSSPTNVSGNVNIETGNSSNVSGDVTLQTGTANPSFPVRRGKIYLKAQNVDVNNTNIVNLANPSLPQDAVTKAYSDAGNPVAASYAITASQAVAANAQVNFDLLLHDTKTAVTTGAAAWKFTAPVAGVYSISGIFQTGGTPNLRIFKNAVAQGYIGSQSVNTSLTTFSTTILLAVNDTIDLRPDSAQTFTAGAAGTYANIINIFLVK